MTTTTTTNLSKRATILALIKSRPVKGYTDAELEAKTGFPHQTVTSARNALMNRGLVQFSEDQTRRSPRGNFVNVWVAAK